MSLKWECMWMALNKLFDDSGLQKVTATVLIFHRYYYLALMRGNCEILKEATSCHGVGQIC